jgi:serine/threonine protein kinase
VEYIDASHLGERAGDLLFEQALWTAIATTRAIRHAHGRGVVHLDLKPANILFRSTEGAWDASKVADWGLPKHLLEHSQGAEGFSPACAAPEQFDSSYGQTDYVTDIHQPKAVCYEPFTGRSPSRTEGGRPEQPAPPSEVADVPEALDEVLLRALATERAERYKHVLYLRDALQALHDDL